jgi:cobalt/nickel transport system permease protein
MNKHISARFQAHDGERWMNAPTAAALVFLGLGANLAATTPVLPAVIAVISITWALMTGIGAKTLASRLAIPWYLAAVAALTQLFLTGNTPIANIGPLVAYAEGAARGLLLASKMVGGASMVMVFGLVAPPSELLGLAARLRVPSVVIEIAMLTYRYLFLLTGEAARIRQAQTVRLGWVTWRRSLACAGELAGMVVVNAYDRSERVYQAMLVRGYTGNVMTTVAVSPMQWWLVGCAALVLAGGVWLGGFR